MKTTSEIVSDSELLFTRLFELDKQADELKRRISEGTDQNQIVIQGLWDGIKFLQKQLIAKLKELSMQYWKAL